MPSQKPSCEDNVESGNVLTENTRLTLSYPQSSSKLIALRTKRTNEPTQPNKQGKTLTNESLQPRSPVPKPNSFVKKQTKCFKLANMVQTVNIMDGISGQDGEGSANITIVNKML